MSLGLWGCASPSNPQTDVGVEVDMSVQADIAEFEDVANQMEEDAGPDLPESGRIVERDLAYPMPPGTDTSFATIDIFRNPTNTPQRLVVLVHGGSWVMGDKANFETAAPALIDWWLEREFIVASVNFRLASRLGMPRVVGPMDQVQDIAHALAFLAERVEDFGPVLPGTVLLGYSSGAHLVALLGADPSYLEEAGLAHEHIAATISADVHVYDVPYALELMVGSVVEQNIPFIRHLFGETEEEQLLASPISYVSGYVAPALLLSVQPSPEDPGSHGYIVSQTAERYRAALEVVGHQASASHFNEETHTSLMVDFGTANHGPTQAVATFLGQTF